MILLLILDVRSISGKGNTDYHSEFHLLKYVKSPQSHASLTLCTHPLPTLLFNWFPISHHTMYQTHFTLMTYSGYNFPMNKTNRTFLQCLWLIILFSPFYCPVLGSGGGRKKNVYRNGLSTRSLHFVHLLVFITKYIASYLHQNKMVNTIINNYYIAQGISLL